MCVCVCVCVCYQERNARSKRTTSCVMSTQLTSQPDGFVSAGVLTYVKSKWTSFSVIAIALGTFLVALWLHSPLLEFAATGTLILLVLLRFLLNSISSGERTGEQHRW